MRGKSFDRREFLRRGALGALTLSSAGAVLAACGDDGDARSTTKTGAPSTSAPGTGSTTIDPSVPWFLQGNFAPVADEVLLDDLEVDGEIPTALSGLYVRNGSNPVRGIAPHWF